MVLQNFTDAPEQNFSRLRRIIPKRLQPLLRGLKKRFFRRFRHLEEPFYAVFPYTQVHPIRQKNLLRIADELEDRNVRGAIVECGVLDGGTAALMAYGTRRSGRDVHLFDSWSGLPGISEEDGEASGVWAGDVVGSPRRVLAVMKSLEIDPDRVKLHKGWFDQTFPIVRIDQVALLHIDADFFESVKLCLERWGTRVSPGGYIQIDDYAAFAGCRKAVDEFLMLHPELTLEAYGGHTQAFYIQIPAS